MPARTILEFIFYIIPGFLAREIYRAIYPGKPISEFSQVTWSIIYGVIIYNLMCWLDTNGYLNSRSSSSSNVVFTLSLFMAGAMLGLLQSLIHYARFKIATRYKRFQRLLPDPQSIWAKINQPTNRDWAVVFLDDNTIYRGYISEYRFDPSEEHQDFLLSEAHRVDESLKELYPIDGIGVYLNTRNVRRIEFIKGKKFR